MFKSSIIVTVLSLILSGVGFISQVLIAKYFGAGKDLDIFLTFSSLPVLVAAILSSALSYSLTPTLIDAKRIFDIEFKNIVGNLIKRILFYVSIIVVFVATGINFLIPRVYTEINIAMYGVGKQVLLLSSITVIATLFAGFFASQFNSDKHFVKPLLLNFLPYLFSIAFLLLFHASLGIVSIPLGIMIGTFISVCISIFILKSQISFNKLSPSANAYVNKYLKKIPIAAVAMLCFTIYQSIDAYWAPKLGPSYLSYLSYCQRLLIAVGALVITGPSTVLIPRLTLAVLEKRSNDFLMDVNLILKVIFSLASVIAIIGSLLSKEIIEIMFQRGAFIVNDTVAIASILPYMLVGMIFMLCVVIMFRMLFVQKKIKFVALIGILSTILYFVFSGIAVYFSTIKGICMSYILTWVILFILCLSKIFIGNTSMYLNKGNFSFLVKQGFIVMVVGVFVGVIKEQLLTHINTQHISGKVIIVLICGNIGLMVFVAMSTYVIKQKEVIFLINGLKSIVKKDKNV
ncbi:Virulence factor mviN-like protein [Arcticibacter svalbardensis MN12-7]|uniref:Virulence factor mviN-like protein n=1 Tax=Arcticibacter svalbardensis MN12-7 TaxID=1150600 RepID=R9GQK5_9SPHI|nr:lipid II flippase MurJ [Arcticibacter svalbardensis]EOR94011.1 Virulence factor mviN-like protein [Arcticibacter svalbardensis MN12-7]